MAAVTEGGFGCAFTLEVDRFAKTSRYTISSAGLALPAGSSQNQGPAKELSSQFKAGCATMSKRRRRRVRRGESSAARVKVLQN